MQCQVEFRCPVQTVTAVVVPGHRTLARAMDSRAAKPNNPRSHDTLSTRNA